MFNIMWKFKSLFLIILIVVCSCDDNVIKTDVIDIPVESNASLTDFISSSNDIVLENSDECILSNIDRLRIDENNLYILDKQSNSICIYNKQGKFINKLARQGRGPQEYLYISDFDIFNNKLHILSRSDKKIIIYNSDMSYASDIKLNDWYNDLFISSDNSIFLYSEKANEQGFDIIDINANGEVINQYLPFLNQDSFRFLISPFNNYKDGGAFITLPYDNKVYTLLDSIFNIKYEFNFLTKDCIKDINGLTYSEIRDKFKSKEVLKQIECIAEYKGNILVVSNIFFENAGYRQLLVLLNKDTKDIKVLRMNDKLDESYPFFGAIIAIHDKMIYSYTNTETIANITNIINKNHTIDVEQIDYNFVIQVSKIKFE